MKTWLTSPSGIIILNIFAFINFIIRALLDWRYVFPEFMAPTSEDYTYTAVFYILILILWFWALLAATQSNRFALNILIVLNFTLLFLLALSTALVLCPTPCHTIWPVSDIINYSNIIFGFLAPLVTFIHLRQKPKPARV